MSTVVEERNKLLINKQSLTDQPIRENVGTPLPLLVKPPMTFKYMQSWRYGLCLWKIIIDSSALFFPLFFPRAALSAAMEKFFTSEGIFKYLNPTL